MIKALMAIQERQAFGVLILLAVLVRCGAVLVLDIEPFSDAGAYRSMASSMFSGQSLDDGLGNIAFYSVGYPLLLSPFYTNLHDGIWATQILNSLLGVLSVGLVYLCAREMGLTWRVAWLCSLAWLFYPPAVLYAEYIAKENLMIPLFLGQTLVLLKLPRTETPLRLSGLFGLLYGAGLLTGAAIILTGVLFPFALWANLKARQGLIAPLMVGAFGLAVMLGPWMTFTHSKLGAPVLATNGSFNLYLGNNPNNGVFYRGIHTTPIGPQWRELRKELGEREAMALLQRKAVDFMAENPGLTLERSVLKVLAFWMPPLHGPESGAASGAEALIRAGWLVAYCAVVLLGLLSLRHIRRFGAQQWIVMASIALYCGVHAAAYIIFRYRLPVMPLVFLMAAVGLQYLLLVWRQHKLRVVVQQKGNARSPVRPHC